MNNNWFRRHWPAIVEWTVFVLVAEALFLLTIWVAVVGYDLVHGH
jgi:hypothetical protein